MHTQLHVLIHQHLNSHTPKRSLVVGFVNPSQTAAESDVECQCLDILGSPNHPVPPSAEVSKQRVRLFVYKGAYESQGRKPV